MRAKIVLAAGDGEGTSSIARLGVSRPTVISGVIGSPPMVWRDWRISRARSGRRRSMTRRSSPRPSIRHPALAVTHWSTRLLGRHLGISDATSLGPGGLPGAALAQGTFKFSTDPELEAKVRDVVGLYLDPPSNAIVLCVDEKSQIQALNRTRRSCRSGPACPSAPRTTTSATGPPPCSPRWRSRPARSPTAAMTGTARPSSSIPQAVARAYPRRELHVVLDNYHTHKHDDINRWLAKNPGSRCTSPRPRVHG